MTYDRQDDPEVMRRDLVLLQRTINEKDALCLDIIHILQQSFRMGVEDSPLECMRFIGTTLREMDMMHGVVDPCMCVTCEGDREDEEARAG